MPLSMTAKETFGQRLARVRHQNLMTQRELAVASGVSPATIANLERGVSGPRYSTLRKLARALDVDPRELLAGE